jgi:hypothetical protein
MKLISQTSKGFAQYIETEFVTNRERLMKQLIKTSITVLLCIYCSIASATKDNAVRLAEELITETKLDVLMNKQLISVSSELSGVSSQEIENKIVMPEANKKELARTLVETCGEQKIKELIKVFADERIKKVLFAYYDVWQHKITSDLLNDNLEKLVKSLQSLNYKPQYVKHPHYGKKVRNDEIFHMMKTLAGFKGDNAIDAFKPWALEQKNITMKNLIAANPVLVGREKELSQVYDYSTDTWISYWLLKEKVELSMADFQATANALESSDALRGFFSGAFNMINHTNAAVQNMNVTMERAVDMLKKKHGIQNK